MELNPNEEYAFLTESSPPNDLTKLCTLPLSFENFHYPSCLLSMLQSSQEVDIPCGEVPQSCQSYCSVLVIFCLLILLFGLGILSRRDPLLQLWLVSKEHKVRHEDLSFKLH